MKKENGDNLIQTNASVNPGNLVRVIENNDRLVIAIV